MCQGLMCSRPDLLDDLAQEIRMQITRDACRLAVELARAHDTTPERALYRILHDHGHRVASQLRSSGISGDGSGRETERLRRKLGRFDARAAQEGREVTDADRCAHLGVGSERLLTLRMPVQLVYDASEDIVSESAPEEMCERQRKMRRAQQLIAHGSRRARDEARDLVGADLYELLAV